jgi:hypothetical protein
LGRAHFVELGKYVVVAVADDNNDNGGGEEVVQMALKPLAIFVRAEKDVKVNDKRTLDEIVKIAVGRRLAKFAARVVILGISDSEGCTSVCFFFLF